MTHNNTLQFSHQFAHTGHGALKKITERDNKRSKCLLAGLHPHGPMAHTLRHNLAARNGSGIPSIDDESVDVTNAGVTYTADVGIGTPPATFTLLIDTGSSNTFVGADKKYVPTATSKSTGDTVQVGYGSGAFVGTEFNDTVTLSPELVIKQQGVAVATQSKGFDGVDGILGIGPVGLTKGTIKNHPDKTIPTVTDNLFTEGKITTNSIGILYEPTGPTTNQKTGRLTFGGVDSSELSGEVHYVPITKQSPASNYWGIDQTIKYGDSTVILKPSAGIVDTGTTLLLIATDAFQAYQKATGAKMDNATGLLTITEDQFKNLKSLWFNIGGVNYEFTANAQLFPRSQISEMGGNEDQLYLVVSDLGNPSGSGLDFINGYAFLQRFYSVYDTTNKRVGLATTEFTTATTN